MKLVIKLYPTRKYTTSPEDDAGPIRMAPKRKAPAPPGGTSRSVSSRMRIDDENHTHTDEVSVTNENDIETIAGLVSGGASCAASGPTFTSTATTDAPRDALAELSIRVEALSGAFGRLAQRGDAGSALRVASDAETAALRERAKGECE